jgi:D-amino peptidase
MAGTPAALLDHSFCSRTIQNLWLNGRKVGEIGIDAAVVGEQGVPTIMVSGDDKACEEARDWIPGVVTCQVKVGFGCQGARLLSMEAAHRLIEERTVEAVRRIKSIRPLKVDHPATVRVEKVERGSVPSDWARPDIRVIDGRTYETTADTVEQAIMRVF